MERKRGREKRKPRICGHCIYYRGDYEDGFCWLDENEPKAVYYNEVACNRGKLAHATG